MAMLSTGKVLVWSTGDNARVWDPAIGTFKLTPFTFGDLHCAGQSTLADGRVIVVGGQNVQTHDGTNITALFDPATETWVNGAPMTRPALVRDQHDAGRRQGPRDLRRRSGRVALTDPRGLRPGHEHLDAADRRPTGPAPVPVHVRAAQRQGVRRRLQGGDRPPGPGRHRLLDARPDRACIRPTATPSRRSSTCPARSCGPAAATRRSRPRWSST